MNTREKCGVTGKLMFVTPDAAHGALAAFARGKGSRRVTKRCVFCGTYHLTKGVRGKPGRGK